MRSVEESRIVLLIFAAIVVRELWCLLPLNYELIHPFFRDRSIAITRQAYCSYACHYACLTILAYTFKLILSEYKEIALYWFNLQVVEFIDYFYSYNNSWFYIDGIGVGITLVKFVVMFTLIINFLLKKNGHDL